MEHLCNEIDLSQPKDKILALFGSSTWNGAGAKALKKFAEEQGFEITGQVVESMGSASVEKIEKTAQEMVDAVAAKLQ